MSWPYQKPYDEDRELTHYIWCHCRNLMTPNELKVGHAAFVSEKASVVKSDRLAKTLTKRSGRDDDPVIAAELRDGIETFRRKVRDRVLRDNPDKIFINRCPKCKCVVRTPKARQCFWCGHDWHEPSG